MPIVPNTRKEHAVCSTRKETQLLAPLATRTEKNVLPFVYDAKRCPEESSRFLYLREIDARSSFETRTQQQLASA